MGWLVEHWDWAYGRAVAPRAALVYGTADYTHRELAGLWSGCCLCLLEVGGFPGVVASGEVGDLLEAGAAEDAGGDGAAIAAFAVDDDELGGVEFAGALG